MKPYQISPITEEAARKIITWRYQPPYDIYDLSENDLKGFLYPEYRYHQVQDQDGNLIGYCCYGMDARVPGGDYQRDEPDVLDIGVGLRPDLTGQGRGAAFLAAILDYAAEVFQPEVFRATVASFNKRSQRVFDINGFVITGSFIRELGEVNFIQLEKLVQEA